MPAVAQPAANGAGSFTPLMERETVDGGYGEWTSWGTCTTTCGGGTQIRSRPCDNPMPQNGGLPCQGESEQTQACSDNPCEIHGEFSEWTAWGTCTVFPQNGDNNGFQTRTRACDNPAPRYNGEVCVGYTSEMQGCDL